MNKTGPFAVRVLVVSLALFAAGTAPGQALPAEPPKALAARDTLPPERAVVLDLGRAWIPHDNTRVDLMWGERWQIEYLPDAVRFTVEDPHRKVLLNLHCEPPVDAAAYPVCVVTYRAQDVAPAPGFGTHLRVTGDGTSRRVLRADALAADGEIHESRFDLRGNIKRVDGLQLAVYSEAKTPAVLDLLQVRFEVAQPETPANLLKAAPIEVAVADAQGAPLRGATVIVDPQWLNFARKALTDADGIARVTPVSDSSPARHVFRAEMPGMAPREITPGNEMRRVSRGDVPAPEAPAPAPGPVRITLDRGVSYSAVIRDEKGKPVPGVIVYLNTGIEGINTHVPDPLIVFPGDGRPWLTRDTLVLHTDELGRWRSPPLPENLAQLTLMLIRAEYVNCRVFSYWNETPPIEEMRKGTAVITVRHGATLEGRVLDANGAPIEKVIVGLEEGQWGYESRGCATNPDGRFRFEGLEPGYHALFFKKRDFAPQAVSARVREGIKPIEVCMHPAAKIRGRVLAPDGRPVAGARVRVYTWHGYHNPLNWHDYQNPLNRGAVTGADGRFSWDEAPDDEGRFTITAPGFLQVNDFPMTASEREYVISLTTAPTFSGQVADAETKAPVNADVKLFIQEQPGDTLFRADRPVLGWSDPSGPPRGASFKLTAVRPAGARHLWVRAAGYESLLTAALKDEEGSRTLSLELKKKAQWTAAVAGPDGVPAADAEVAIGEPGVAILIRDGRAVPTSTDGDPYVLDYAADSEAHIQSFVTPREGSDPLWFTPWTPASPVRQDLVRRSDGGGRFILTGEPAFSPVVVIHPSGYAVATVGDCAGPAGLRLQPWGKLEGLLRVGGKPAPGQTVAAEWASKATAVSWSFRAVTDPQGRFAFERVPAGTARVRHVVSEGWFTSYRHTAVAEIKSGATCAVTLGETEHPVVGKLELALPDGTEPDWSLARVTLAPRSAGAAERTVVAVQADGAFSAEGVQPAEYYDLTAALYQPGGQHWPLTGEIVAGAGRGITVPNSTEPLNLGVIRLRAAGALETELPAPEWQAQTTAGKHVSSKDFRGKFLLLVFWTPGTLGMERDADLLKAVHEKYKADPRLVMLSIAPADSAVVKDYAKRKGLNWEHCVPTGASRPDVLFAYGVPQPLDAPCCFLIGPDGKVAAKNMRSEDAPKALEWKLQPPKTPAH